MAGQRGIRIEPRDKAVAHGGMDLHAALASHVVDILDEAHLAQLVQLRSQLGRT